MLGLRPWALNPKALKRLLKPHGPKLVLGPCRTISPIARKRRSPFQVLGDLLYVLHRPVGRLEKTIHGSEDLLMKDPPLGIHRDRKMKAHTIRTGNKGIPQSGV